MIKVDPAGQLIATSAEDGKIKIWEPGKYQLIKEIVVEENDGAQRMLEQGQQSYRLHVAGDGEEALDFLFRRPPFQDKPRPDIVLLDINMSVMDGYEVLKNLRNAKIETPILILSSLPEPSHVDLDTLLRQKNPRVQLSPLHLSA